MRSNTDGVTKETVDKPNLGRWPHWLGINNSKQHPKKAKTESSLKLNIEII